MEVQSSLHQFTDDLCVTLSRRSVQTCTLELHTHTHTGSGSDVIRANRISAVSMTHCVAGVDVSTCGQVPVDHQQLLLITGLKEVVFVHIIRLQTHVT